MAVMLHKMEIGGTIKRKTGEDNARIKEISLTKKGRAQVEETRKIASEVDEVMLRGVGEEELAVFNRVLGKMWENLRTEYPDAANALRHHNTEEQEDKE